MIRLPGPTLPLLSALCALSGCVAPLPDDGGNPDPRCQPIAPGGLGRCFLPYPSSFYLKPDATTATGFRVAIPPGLLPKNQVDIDFDPVHYNRLDGFSAAAQLLVDLGVRVGKSQLIGERDDYARTLSPDSPVQLLDFLTGERVALFAEVDHNAEELPLEPQALLIHPTVRLRSNRRYVVALRGLKDQAGQPIVLKGFRTLVEGTVAANSTLKPVQARYEELFTRLEQQGVPRRELTLAWDFRTASEEQAWGNVIAMRDAAFKRWEKDGLGVTVTRVRDAASDADLAKGHPLVSRRVEGTFAVPSFLDDRVRLYPTLQRDAAGRPVDTGRNLAANFLLQVPKCAESAKGPLPILVYGHGLFGAASEIQGGDDELTANTLCMVQVATDWIGLAEEDAPYVVAKIAQFDQLQFAFDKMQQAQVNFAVLARLAARRLPKESFMQLGGRPVSDGKQVYYYGNSQGGIEGQTLLAISPEIGAGVLGVGAGVYSLMIFRSGDFRLEKSISDDKYPLQIDQQLLWLLAQSQFDFSDPSGFAQRTIRDPLPDENGVPMKPKRVLMQCGRWDIQVPNVASHVIARTLGLKVLAKGVAPIWGLDEAKGPLDSAYTEWDVHPKEIPPPVNAPPGRETDGSTGHSVHEAVRRLPEAIEQMRRFLKPDGKVEQTCKGGAGPCDYP